MPTITIRDTMSRQRDQLNNAPDKANTALVLIDVINPIDFEGGGRLLEHALPMAKALATLKRRAKAAKIPAVYVNDNFGRWRSDFRHLVEAFLQTGVRGKPIVEILQPEEDDYFVLKPKHSAFHQTNLEILLGYLGADTLILTGMAGDICVLFSANDAYMRDFRLFIPPDCTASEDCQENQRVLSLMSRVLKADLKQSAELQFHQTRIVD